jgi:hypothetical protein
MYFRQPTGNQEYDHADKWYTKGAEAGLPVAMFTLGVRLAEGRGMAAPGHPAAAGWFRRAADAGSGDAANNLCQIYSFGRGRAWRIMPGSSSSIF